MRELLLLRHGKSDWTVEVSDFRRPLKDRGRRESMRIGAWLKEAERVPGQILCSTAVRAQETAELVCEAMGFSTNDIRYEDGLYMAGLQALISYLQNLSPDNERVMLVGHNPGLELLLVHLAGAQLEVFAEVEAEEKILPTATVAGLMVEGDWQHLAPQSCQLEFLRRGRLLT